jgi:carbon storage regulator
MLVLSRRKGESITIAGGIKITVVGHSGPNIRLGIDAPRETGVIRTELLELRRIGRAPFAIVLGDETLVEA